MATQNLVSEQRWTTLSGVKRRRRLPEIDAIGKQYLTVRMAALLEHKENLLREVQHRVGNSLQLIASILALDARNARSEETRLHLTNAHMRVLAVAAIQQQLDTTRESGDCELADFLRRLCENLTASIVNTTRIAINVEADASTVSSTFATNIGLIITELVINAVKHAFVAERVTGKIFVTYRSHGASWKLVVSDDGIGGRHAGDTTSIGLGASIVEALVKQLEARKEILTSSHGRLVSITHIDESFNNPAG